MKFDEQTRVQCFYNANFNLGSPDGQLKFAWGFGWFYLHGEVNPLVDQLVEKLKYDKDEMFNINLTSLTPFPDSVFEQEE
jgi:hypothetical protein